MSWKASADAKKITHDKEGLLLSPTDKCVLMVLADYTNPESGCAFPSVPTLAKYAGLKTRRTQMILARLQAGGVISIERRRHGLARNLSNLYRITPASECTPVPQCTTPVPQCTTPLHPGTPPWCNSVHHPGATDCTQTRSKTERRTTTSTVMTTAWPLAGEDAEEDSFFSFQGG